VAFKVWKASSDRAVRSAREDEAEPFVVVVVVVVVVWGVLHVSASDDSESESEIPSSPASRGSFAMMIPGFFVFAMKSWGNGVWWFFHEVFGLRLELSRGWCNIVESPLDPFGRIPSMARGGGGGRLDSFNLLVHHNLQEDSGFTPMDHLS
jgi:hypothetical protein